MKKTLIIILFLIASKSYAVNPIPISAPYLFQTYIWVKDSITGKILIIPPRSAKPINPSSGAVINYNGQFQIYTGSVWLPIIGYTAEDVANKGQINGYASLDANGKIPSSQLNSFVISNTYVVESMTAMLSLTANVGDLAVRTDSSKTFILQSTPASIYSHWVILATSGSAVLTVNGQTGNVNLTASDVGAIATETDPIWLSVKNNYYKKTSTDSLLLLKADKGTTVNGHALSSNIIISASDLTTGTLPHAQLPVLVSGDIPNNAANTTGTAAGLTNQYIDANLSTGGASIKNKNLLTYKSDSNIIFLTPRISEYFNLLLYPTCPTGRRCLAYVKDTLRENTGSGWHIFKTKSLQTSRSIIMYPDSAMVDTSVIATNRSVGDTAQMLRTKLKLKSSVSIKVNDSVYLGDTIYKEMVYITNDPYSANYVNIINGINSTNQENYAFESNSINQINETYSVTSFNQYNTTNGVNSDNQHNTANANNSKNQYNLTYGNNSPNQENRTQGNFSSNQLNYTQGYGSIPVINNSVVCDTIGIWQKNGAEKARVTGQGYIILNATDTVWSTAHHGSGGSGTITSVTGHDQIKITGTTSITVGLKDSTGSGKPVLQNSPTLITPNIAKIGNLTTNSLLKTTESDGTLSYASAGSDYQAPIANIGDTIKYKQKGDTTTLTGYATNNKLYNVENTTRTIYCSPPPTGNDTTGNGSSGTPFRSLLRCLQDIKTNVGAQIYVVVNYPNATYNFTTSEREELLKKKITNSFDYLSKIAISGAYTLVENNITPSFANPDLGKITYSGKSWTTDQLKHYFVTTASTFFTADVNAAPIYSNGSNYIQTVAALGSTYKYIIQTTTTLNIQDASTNSELLDFKEQIEFRGFNIVRTSGALWFRYGKTRLLMCNITVPSNKSITFNNGDGLFITGCLLTKASNNTSSSPLIYLNTSTNPNVTKVNLVNVIFEYPSLNVNNVGIGNLLGLVYVYTSAMFVNCNSVLLFYGQSDFLAHNSVRLWNCTNLLDVSSSFTSQVSPRVIINNLIIDSVTSNYLINNIGFYDSHFTITGSIYGKYTGIWNPSGSNYKTYNSPGNNYSIIIPGIFRENENATSFTLANNSTDSIIIGDKTYNRLIEIDYNITRGSSYKSQHLRILHNGTLLKLDSLTSTTFGLDCGVTLNGAYYSSASPGNFIKLKWTTSNTGVSAVLKCDFKRQNY